MAHRHYREFIKEVKSAGLTLLQVDCAGSGHLRGKVRVGAGPVRTVIYAATPSDWRATRNFRTQLRHLVRECTDGSRRAVAHV